MAILMPGAPPQRDGTPDTDEIKIVSEIGVWMKVNGDAIYATCPWNHLWRGPFDRRGGEGTVRRPTPRFLNKSFTA